MKSTLNISQLAEIEMNLMKISTTLVVYSICVAALVALYDPEEK